MFTLIREVQYAKRTLLRARALTLTAILTLGIGVAAVTTMAGVVDAMLIRSVPFRHPGQLLVIWQSDRMDASRIGEVSHFFFRRWQAHSQSFSELAAFGSVNWSFDLQGRGERRAIPVAAVSWSFFRTLGVTPAIGRLFVAEDDRPQAARVVVVGYGFWQSALGGDPGVVGQSLTLSGTRRTVVGVMPAGFDFPRGASMWAPVVPELASVSIGQFQALEAPGFGVLYVLGRLRDGVGAGSAAEDLYAIDRAYAAAQGFRNVAVPRPVLTPLRDYVSENTRPALYALAATCVAILLIAAGNVASLLLMRVSSSRRLFAIRAALGASRARILREEVIVATMLGTAGTVVGVVVSAAAARVILALAPSSMPLLLSVRVDYRVLACAGIAGMIAVLACGVIPALSAGGAASGQLMGSRVTGGPGTNRLRNVLVVLQVGGALVLLLLAGISIESARNIRAIDLGFRPEHLVTLSASLPDANAVQQQQFSRDLLTAIRALPGVTAAAAVSLRPLEYGLIGEDMSFLLEGQRPFPAPDSSKNPLVVYEEVTPEYFRTMGTPILAGRDFDEHDDATAPQAVIVSEGLARAMWPGENAVGRRLQLSNAVEDSKGLRPWSTVVGVVGDIRYRSVTDRRPDLYACYGQSSGPVPELMIRTTDALIPLVASVRARAAALNPNAHIGGVDTLPAIVTRATATWTFNMWLFSVFGTTALVLAAVGLYGLLAHLVTERTREIGVRLALGATPRRLAVAVLGRALHLTIAGLVSGVAVATILGRFAERLVYEVRPLDTAIVALTCLLLLAVAAAASYIPARRVTAVDPATVLRME